MQGIDYVNSMLKVLQSRIVVCAHVHLLHLVGACGLTAKKLVSRVTCYLSRKTCEGQKQNTESTISMTMTSCHESSCLAIKL